MVDTGVQNTAVFELARLRLTSCWLINFCLIVRVLNKCKNLYYDSVARVV